MCIVMMCSQAGCCHRSLPYLLPKDLAGIPYPVPFNDSNSGNCTYLGTLLISALLLKNSAMLKTLLKCCHSANLRILKQQTFIPFSSFPLPPVASRH